MRNSKLDAGRSEPSRQLFVGVPAALAMAILPVASGGRVEASGTPVPVQQEEAPPALAGLWEIDPEESDDPAAIMAEARERAEAGRSGRRGRAGARRGGGARGGRGGPPARGGLGFESLPDTLEIEAGDGEMRLVLEERVRIFYLDGEEHVREGARGGRIETVAEVRGGIVRVTSVRETRAGDTKTFRTFEANGDVLVVRTEITPPRGGDSLLIRSVFRRIPT